MLKRKDFVLYRKSGVRWIYALMTVPGPHRTNLAPILVFLASLAIAPASMRAQTLDSLRAALPIAGVYHLNFDCWPDTVLAERTARGGVLPRAIVWGHPKPGGGSGQGGSGIDTSCLGPIPPALRKPFTLFTYPAWAQPGSVASGGSAASGGSVAFGGFNGDSLTDIFFYLRGRVQSGSAGRWHDTVRRMVVFGQHALDTLSTINLADVPAFQFAPFFAMNLSEGVHLSERATRDLSGAPSYILHPVSLQVNAPNVGAPNVPATHERAPMVGMPMAGIVRVYPNPAATAAGVEAVRLEAGEYTVEVVATNGRVELRRRVSVAASGTLLETLDVSGLASGYYVVRVTRDGAASGAATSGGAVTGTYPIVVAH